MKKFVLRKNVFETNSSSQHSLIIPKEDEDFETFSSLLNFKREIKFFSFSSYFYYWGNHEFNSIEKKLSFIYTAKFYEVYSNIDSKNYSDVLNNLSTPLSFKDIKDMIKKDKEFIKFKNFLVDLLGPLKFEEPLVKKFKYFKDDYDSFYPLINEESLKFLVKNPGLFLKFIFDERSYIFYGENSEANEETNIELF